MSRTKFRVSEPCGGVEEVSMCSVPPVGGARGSQHHARNVFCKYKTFYRKKKKKAEPGAGTISGLLLCFKQCSFPTKQLPHTLTPRERTKKELTNEAQPLRCKGKGCHPSLVRPKSIMAQEDPGCRAVSLPEVHALLRNPCP